MTREETKEAIDMIKHILEVAPKEPPEECDYVDEWLCEDAMIRKTLNVAIKALEQREKIEQIIDEYDLEAWEVLEMIKEVMRA